jgi:hypothetical protein
MKAEVQALRDKCEELADDVRALSALLHGLQSALVTSGMSCLESMDWGPLVAIGE